jgi:hypothetical protein
LSKAGEKMFHLHAPLGERRGINIDAQGAWLICETRKVTGERMATRAARTADRGHRRARRPASKDRSWLMTHAHSLMRTGHSTSI